MGKIRDYCNNCHPDNKIDNEKAIEKIFLEDLGYIVNVEIDNYLGIYNIISFEVKNNKDYLDFNPNIYSNLTDVVDWVYTEIKTRQDKISLLEACVGDTYKTKQRIM